MATKKVTKVKQKPETAEPLTGDTPVGFLNITLFLDGTYEVKSDVAPEYIMLYANLLADIAEGKITSDIVQKWAGDDEVRLQQSAMFVSSFFQTLNNSNKPIIPPSKVFRNSKSK